MVGISCVGSKTCKGFPTWIGVFQWKVSTVFRVSQDNNASVETFHMVVRLIHMIKRVFMTLKWLSVANILPGLKIIARIESFVPIFAFPNTSWDSIHYICCADRKGIKVG